MGRMPVERADAKNAGQAGWMEQNPGGTMVEPVKKRRIWLKWSLLHAAEVGRELTGRERFFGTFIY